MVIIKQTMNTKLQKQALSRDKVNSQNKTSLYPRLKEVIIDIEQSRQCDSYVHHGVKDEACVDVNKAQPDTAVFQVLHKECWQHT